MPDFPLPPMDMNSMEEMAKAMKEEGEPIDKIVKYSQLSIQEIEKL